VSDTVSVKHATVLQRRPLRDGRQIVEIDCACGDTHWILNPASLVECLSQPGKFMWVDGLASAAGRVGHG
jgi:hypothetical protein